MSAQEVAPACYVDVELPLDHYRSAELIIGRLKSERKEQQRRSPVVQQLDGAYDVFLHARQKYRNQLWGDDDSPAREHRRTPQSS